MRGAQAKVRRPLRRFQRWTIISVPRQIMLVIIELPPWLLP